MMKALIKDAIWFCCMVIFSATLLVILHGDFSFFLRPSNILLILMGLVIYLVFSVVDYKHNDHSMAFDRVNSLDSTENDQNEPEGKIRYTSDLLLTHSRLWPNRSASKLSSMTVKKLKQICLRYWISAFLMVFCLCVMNDVFSLLQEPKLWVTLLVGFAIVVTASFLDIVFKKRKSGPQ